MDRTWLDLLDELPGQDRDGVMVELAWTVERYYADDLEVSGGVWMRDGKRPEMPRQGRLLHTSVPPHPLPVQRPPDPLSDRLTAVPAEGPTWRLTLSS